MNESSSSLGKQMQPLHAVKDLLVFYSRIFDDTTTPFFKKCCFMWAQTRLFLCSAVPTIYSHLQLVSCNACVCYKHTPRGGGAFRQARLRVSSARMRSEDYRIARCVQGSRGLQTQLKFNHLLCEQIISSFGKRQH